MFKSVLGNKIKEAVYAAQPTPVEEGAEAAFDPTLILNLVQMFLKLLTGGNLPCNLFGLQKAAEDGDPNDTILVRSYQVIKQSEYPGNAVELAGQLRAMAVSATAEEWDGLRTEAAAFAEGQDGGGGDDGETAVVVTRSGRTLARVVVGLLLCAAVFLVPRSAMAETKDEAITRITAEIAAIQAQQAREAILEKLSEHILATRIAIPESPPADVPDVAPKDLPPELQSTPEALTGWLIGLLNLQPADKLGDIGCGDAKMLIAAVKAVGCEGVGIERNPQRAALARKNVEEAGLTDRILIIEGDAKEYDLKNLGITVAYVYLFEDALTELKPKLLALDRVVSFQHRIPGETMTVHHNDGAKAYTRGAVPRPARTTATLPTVQNSGNAAVWRGKTYRAPVCNSRWCSMCNSIRRQLRD